MTKYVIKHIDIDGLFTRLNKVDIPNDVDVFKVSYVMEELPAFRVDIIDNIETFLDLIKEKDYIWKDNYSSLIISTVDGKMKEYKIKTRFYYLEKLES